MKILKASAGSGKTYRLSKTYTELLLGSQSPDAYRHILAVTFTNKATAEMKSRILRDLYRSDKPKARRLLVDILHDYGSFSVSTIDKFFQQTLKSFSREIGQFADYQIELDKDSLIRESMDRILDSLTPDNKELLSWIKASISESLEQGKRLSIDDSLYEMGRLLKSEEHRELSEKSGADDAEAFAQKRLLEVRKACSAIIRDFAAILKSHGLDVSAGDFIKMPGKRLLAKDPELASYIDEAYSAYATAFIVNSLTFSLGLAGEFYREFEALLKEKNLMCLDESNTILRDIINGSDAPFVYEKLGVRYEHFLLDEFQDTSNIQWDNFLPLLRESESRGEGSLVVGDVKQSIYRFRDSDWHLLAHKVKEEFPEADVETLDCNWRSTRRVVSFNNAFFTRAAEALGLEDIYSDVSQTPMTSDEQEGQVRLSFCEDQLEAVMSSVTKAREAGAGWGDIAVLVRGKKQGADIADYLISNKVPVISDDSLNMKSSGVVRRLTALLGAFENPDDSISSFLAESLGITFPQTYHSLVDLCESLLRSLKDRDPASFEGETLFIQAFMDELQSWTEVNGNSLRYFLEHWEEQERFIGSPENSAAVRILTIHKSKGLEFPYVIFPYADKVGFYKSGVHWCRLDAGSARLPSCLDGIYPVNLGSQAEASCFSGAVDEERRRQIVDNMNLFYVALTRAGKCLHIISAPPTATFKKSLKSGRPDYKKMSDLLYEFGGCCDERSFGEEYDFSRMERKEASPEEEFPIEFASVPLAGRLAPSSDAADFFGDDGQTGVKASARLRGVVLHNILSAVVSADDLEPAVAAALMDGSLDARDASEAREMLSERIAAHPEWFPSSEDREVRVLNETSLFAADGREYRPDRVIVRPEGVVVVDFKFARPEDRYLRQVGNYAAIYRQLGYNVLAAVIWYVEEDKMEII